MILGFARWILFYCRYSRLLWLYHQKIKTLTENPTVQIYPHKIKNRIAFRIKTDYKLELLIPETLKLIGSAEKDVDKDKNGENVP